MAPWRHGWRLLKQRGFKQQKTRHDGEMVHKWSINGG